MKILLTGADGFTGRPFALAARAAGHETVGLKADLTDAAAVAKEVTQLAPEAVVHLAAISFVGHTNESAFYAVNVVGTTNLLTTLATLPVPPHKVLLASSANIYGNCDASPITEVQPPSPVNHYAMSKLAMEYMAFGYAKKLPLIITRPFNYTGPGQATNFVIPKLVDHFSRRVASIALGNLYVEREFNDVQMINCAYLNLLTYGKPGEIYNVCSGQPYTLKYVLELLERITGHSIKVEVNPAFVRANEVHRLYGDPIKLDALLTAHGVKLFNPSLEETLKRMLKANVLTTTSQ